MNEDVIIITGINGFIGKMLLSKILSTFPNTRIIGIDRHAIGTDCEVCALDLQDLNDVESLLVKNKPIYVFHLAGSLYSKNWKTLYGDNVLTSINIMEAVYRNKLNSRIILIGSAAEYGNINQSNLPVSEDCNLNPITPYGLSKVWQTNSMNYFLNLGIDVAMGRVFNIIGKGASEKQAIGAFINQIKLIQSVKEPSIISVGNLKSMRDYLDIEDVCDGLTAIAKKGKRGQVYNICSGNPISIEDILRGLIEASQLNVEIVIDKVRFQAADVNRIFGSNHNIAQDTSWKQQISIKDSLKEAIK